jgi:hypothetical protein
VALVLRAGPGQGEQFLVVEVVDERVAVLTADVGGDGDDVLQVAQPGVDGGLDDRGEVLWGDAAPGRRVAGREGDDEDQAATGSSRSRQAVSSQASRTRPAAGSGSSGQVATTRLVSPARDVPSGTGTTGGSCGSVRSSPNQSASDHTGPASSVSVSGPLSRSESVRTARPGRAPRCSGGRSVSSSSASASAPSPEPATVAGPMMSGSNGCVRSKAWIWVLVDRQNHRPGRRIQVQPDDSVTFSAKRGSRDSLNVPCRCGCRSLSRHSFATQCQDTATPSTRET